MVLTEAILVGLASASCAKCSKKEGLQIQWFHQEYNFGAWRDVSVVMNTVFCSSEDLGLILTQYGHLDMEDSLLYLCVHLGLDLTLSLALQVLHIYNIETLMQAYTHTHEIKEKAVV